MVHVHMLRTIWMGQSVQVISYFIYKYRANERVRERVRYAAAAVAGWFLNTIWIII